MKFALVHSTADPRVELFINLDHVATMQRIGEVTVMWIAMIDPDIETVMRWEVTETPLEIINGAFG